MNTEAHDLAQPEQPEPSLQAPASSLHQLMPVGIILGVSLIIAGVAGLTAGLGVAVIAAVVLTIMRGIQDARHESEAIAVAPAEPMPAAKPRARPSRNAMARNYIALGILGLVLVLVLHYIAANPDSFLEDETKRLLRSLAIIPGFFGALFFFAGLIKMK